MMIVSIRILLKTAAAWMLMAAAVGAAENPWDIRYPFKSATVTYEISGTETGSETLYIDGYGKKQARFRKSALRVMNRQMNTDKVEITTEQWHYDIDLASRTGSKTTNPNRYFRQEYEKLSDEEKRIVRKNAEEMGKSALGGMQGTVEKNAATLLGYRCDKTTYMGTTVYAMHDTGIPLKTETDMMGMRVKSTAVKFDKGAVPSNVFIPPKGIAITFDEEADAMMRQMAKNMIATMKDPEAAEKMKEQGAGYARQPSSGSSPGQDEPSEDALQKSLEGLKGMFGN
jgi:hypothetical protein